jgi:hypothetical protein
LPSVATHTIALVGPAGEGHDDPGAGLRIADLVHAAPPRASIVPIAQSRKPELSARDPESQARAEGT